MSKKLINKLDFEMRVQNENARRCEHRGDDAGYTQCLAAHAAASRARSALISKMIEDGEDVSDIELLG